MVYKMLPGLLESAYTFNSEHCVVSKQKQLISLARYLLHIYYIIVPTQVDGCAA